VNITEAGVPALSGGRPATLVQGTGPRKADSPIEEDDAAKGEASRARLATDRMLKRGGTRTHHGGRTASPRGAPIKLTVRASGKPRPSIMALVQPSGLSGEESESAVALAVNAELHLRQSPCRPHPGASRFLHLAVRTFKRTASAQVAIVVTTMKTGLWRILPRLLQLWRFILDLLGGQENFERRAMRDLTVESTEASVIRFALL
jgi:hypothetical protein